MLHNKLILAICCLIVISAARDCFGEECSHITPTVSRGASNAQIGMAVEQEVRRQYWYYLNNAVKIYEAQLEMGNRVLFFFFHRNLVGTFFIICSWYHNEGYSEVNTFVRVGNGIRNGDSTTPMNIDPFVITIQDLEGNDQEATFQDGVITIGGTVVPTDQLEASCLQMSDQVLRKSYWYYLNGAQLTYQSALAIPQRTYAVLTYVNIVGTFLVISSCNGDQVTANTFVRLGRGTNNNQSVVLDPVILAINA